jgi:hypothetical protein
MEHYLHHAVQDSSPLRADFPASRGRLVDSLGPDAEDGARGAPGPAEDVDPAVGDPLPRVKGDVGYLRNLLVRGPAPAEIATHGP